MRVRSVLSVLCVTLTLPGGTRAQKASPSPAGSGGSSRLYYYATPRTTLETEVHTVPPDDPARFDRLKSLFAGEGCSGDQLKIEPLGGARSDPGNLVCTWRGDSTSTVVVLAEYQRKGKGEGAIENWSGAAPMPYLYFAMQARPRENTWVFVESGGKSGVADYVRSLSTEQKKQIRSMVVLTSLGVSPAILFYSPVEDVYLPPPVAHLQMSLALATISDAGVPRPEALNPFRWLTSDPTQPFRYIHVPSIILHSIPDRDAALPGSAHDTAAAIDGNAYFLNYRAIAVFLVGLDTLATRLNTDDRIWHGEQGQFHIDPDDLPYIH
jgi:hypothetical protein